MRSPLEKRRLWFVGIGGAGLSGYALLAQAWGAEVGGWDRYETPYLAHVRAAGIPVTIAPEPVAPPEGWESVVSTAFAGRAEGRSRADLLRELVALRRSIVVAGAHGKTTTAAMVAFVLDRLGLDLRRQVGELLAEPARLARMADAMRALARPDAADVVAEELLGLAAA